MSPRNIVKFSRHKVVPEGPWRERCSNKAHLVCKSLKKLKTNQVQKRAHAKVRESLQCIVMVKLRSKVDRYTPARSNLSWQENGYTRRNPARAAAPKKAIWSRSQPRVYSSSHSASRKLELTSPRRTRACKPPSMAYTFCCSTDNLLRNADICSRITSKLSTIVGLFSFTCIVIADPSEARSSRIGC